MQYAIRFRLVGTTDSDPSDLLDDVHDYFLLLGHDVEVVRGELGPNWFALVLELPSHFDAEDFAFDLARDFNAGFPHRQLVAEIADDAGRRLYPRPQLVFDA